MSFAKFRAKVVATLYAAFTKREKRLRDRETKKLVSIEERETNLLSHLSSSNLRDRLPLQPENKRQQVMHFNIADEDGFIAIVNADRYKGFVSEDWELDQLFTHFTNEMNHQNVIVWQTDSEGGGLWSVAVLSAPSANDSFREFSKTITVTDGHLYFATYTDLTMAAQFEDEKIPSNENADLKIAVVNGNYEVIVRQLFNPDDLGEHDTDFEIILTKVEDDVAMNSEGVYWWSE